MDSLVLSVTAAFIQYRFRTQRRYPTREKTNPRSSYKSSRHPLSRANTKNYCLFDGIATQERVGWQGYMGWLAVGIK